jgi:hypothetical protein
VPLFLDNNEIVFSGKNGSAGGNAGTINFTTPAYKLFNTTNAIFTGVGGYSSASGSVGGDGGKLQLNYWGLIKKFNFGGASIAVTAGSSLDSGSGVEGGTVYNRDTVTVPRDVDLNDEGIVSLFDYLLITQNYNNVAGDSGYSIQRDINNDTRLNVIEIARI